MQIPFPNPPITEAILDIRVSLPKEITLDVLASLHQDIKEQFPTRKERHTWEGGFQVKPGAPPEILSKPDRVDGYLFLSPNGEKIVQSRLDGFTFNKLKPYSNWETFSKEAKYYWEHYIKIVKPINVTRIALRYINRIEIPLPIKDFKEYFLTVPEVAPGVPQGLSGLFMQLVIPKEEIGSTAIITMTYDKVDPNKAVWPFIFDIDAFNNNVLLPNSIEIWKKLEQLREFKNQIFLNTMTNKTKEMFK